MPKVGKKEFSYTEKGKAEAKAYAEKTGQNIEKGSSPMAYESNDARNRSQVYKKGGKVEYSKSNPGDTTKKTKSKKKKSTIKSGSVWDRYNKPKGYTKG
tara:strand:- start:287 stop:583 length:297 start_codon:yes stop_codon:yes gene_type:complete